VNEVVTNGEEQNSYKDKTILLIFNIL